MVVTWSTDFRSMLVPRSVPDDIWTGCIGVVVGLHMAFFQLKIMPSAGRPKCPCIYLVPPQKIEEAHPYGALCLVKTGGPKYFNLATSPVRLLHPWCLEDRSRIGEGLIEKFIKWVLFFFWSHEPLLFKDIQSFQNQKVVNDFPFFFLSKKWLLYT